MSGEREQATFTVDKIGMFLQVVVFKTKRSMRRAGDEGRNRGLRGKIGENEVKKVENFHHPFPTAVEADQLTKVNIMVTHRFHRRIRGRSIR